MSGKKKNSPASEVTDEGSQKTWSTNETRSTQYKKTKTKKKRSIYKKNYKYFLIPSPPHLPTHPPSKFLSLNPFYKVPPSWISTVPPSRPSPQYLNSPRWFCFNDEIHNVKMSPWNRCCVFVYPLLDPKKKKKTSCHESVFTAPNDTTAQSKSKNQTQDLWSKKIKNKIKLTTSTFMVLVRCPHTGTNMRAAVTSWFMTKTKKIYII